MLFETPGWKTVSDPKGKMDKKDPSLRLGQTAKKRKRRREREGESTEFNRDKVVEPRHSDMHSEDRQPEGRSLSRGDASLSTRVTKESKLLKSMQKRLETGRFRQINEMLYTQDSESSRAKLHEDPSLYEEYHIGFREATQKWPVKPVEVVASWLKSFKNDAVRLVADLGCGDAALAKALKSYHLRIMSYDLIGDVHEGGEVIPADIAKMVPLASATVDIVILCLALMPTTWPSIIAEAHRILRQGGILKLAEVTSRLKDHQAFIKALQQAGFGVQRERDSNSHFVLLTLVKKSATFDPTNLKSELLQPCIYKRR